MLISLSQSSIPHDSSPQLPATEGLRFCLLGGFLGSGKTSFVTAFAGWLRRKDLKVGLVANDQAGGLVDELRFKGAEGRNQGDSAVESVTGGCFCCKADELVAKLQKLATEARPDIIVAEPVGSCTDLVATVVRPLQQVYGLGFSMAPYVVLVDAKKLLQGLKSETPGFSADVEYIFYKQLEEADVVVVDKVDLLKTADRKAVLAVLAKRYPGKAVLEVSVKRGDGLDAVFTLLERAERLESGSMEVDYERYAVGEALLGWYNAECSIHATGEGFDGNQFLKTFAGNVQKACEGQGMAIAHLKLSLVPVNAKQSRTELGVVQVVSNGEKLELSQTLTQPLKIGNMLINVRAEGNAHVIRRAVREQVNASKEARLVWRDEAAFQPGKPVPVHRIA